MENLFSVQGKTALVTGSTGALGFTFAKGLARYGAKVVLNGRNEQKLELVTGSLRKEGLDVYGYSFDVTESNQVNHSIAQIEEQVGPIEILVNNAGITKRAPLENFREEDWRTIIDTNLTGPFLVAKAVARYMIQRNRGKIINIGSVQSVLGRATIAPYTASKGGIKLLTRGMAIDWAKYNIQVNGIGPGYFKTEMTRPLYEDPEFDAWLCGRTPSNRWGEPDELLGALLFLCSDASSYVNGHMVYVDGGLLATV
jgi:gluconate 5-dehydrogenase